MYPSEFEYYSPATVNEALEQLSNSAKILAGGQSLLPLLKSRFASFSKLVDISRLGELDFVKAEDNMIKIGSLRTIASLEADPLITGRQPLISEAASQIADPLVRNMGTIGGNVSHSDPANDMPPVMLALGAEFVAASSGGERRISAEEFFVDSFQTSLKENELLKEVDVTVRRSGEGYAYAKLKKGSADFSVAAVACVIKVEGKKIVDAKIAAASVAPKAMLLKSAQDVLLSKKFSGSSAKEAGRAASLEADPQSDSYGSKEYKRIVLGNLVEDAVMKAFERAGGTL